MRSNLMATMFVLSVVAADLTFAEGIVCQLPEEGAWARFDIDGAGVGPNGAVRVTVKGTQTIRCVGIEDVQGEPCRWIEVDTDSTFERTGNAAGKLHVVFKLLISEKHLAEGANPREGVRVAYHKQGDAPAKRLDGADARQVESMEELFHAPLETLKPLPTESVNAAGTTWECRGVEGRQATDAEVFSTVTRLHKEAPFGVVTYSYDKRRLRDGQPAGGRSMSWKLAETGAGAVPTPNSAQSLPVFWVPLTPPVRHEFRAQRKLHWRTQ
jgi:hypothetical protein